ncbi:DUF1878 family protein [Bacillus massilinigeriensis]|uniref:DUF1878 family protein n=1 Tax=Bacillus mediterraneensis TaxID=1805474 RepID=UPI0008F84A31|nr:DUF1878 family protein [Bacillus mediterraneensis]
MDITEILDRIKRLEFHQKLLLQLIKDSSYPFYEYILRQTLSEEEVSRIMKTCERLSKEFQKQKAEGFVHFHPLYKDFCESLAPRLEAEEIMEALRRQGLYVALMTELEKYKLN